MGDVLRREKLVGGGHGGLIEREKVDVDSFERLVCEVVLNDQHRSRSFLSNLTIGSSITQLSTILMNDATSSPADEIATLKFRLATAENRLERAQSFVFDLRCLGARKDGRGLWVRERDRSGMRAGAWGETEGLGPWNLIKVSPTFLPTSLASCRLIVNTEC